MRHLKLWTLLAMVSCQAQSQEKVSMNDLAPIFETTWEGTLTYKNYSDGKPVSLPCQLTLTRVDEHTIEYVQEYPTEPKANSKGKWEIGKDGSTFNGSEIVSKRINSDQDLEFTVRSEGQDNGIDSTMFITYTIGNESLSYVKEVLHHGTTERFVRNKYEYQKSE